MIFMKGNEEEMNVTLNDDIQVIEEETDVEVEPEIVPEVAPEVELEVEPEVAPEIEPIEVEIENPKPEAKTKLDEMSDVLGVENKITIYVTLGIGLFAFALIIVCLLFSIYN